MIVEGQRAYVHFTDQAANPSAMSFSLAELSVLLMVFTGHSSRQELTRSGNEIDQIMEDLAKTNPEIILTLGRSIT